MIVDVEINRGSKQQSTHFQAPNKKLSHQALEVVSPVITHKFKLLILRLKPRIFRNQIILKLQF
jgi:hypothetical protein